MGRRGSSSKPPPPPKNDPTPVVYCDCKPENMRAIGGSGKMFACDKHDALTNIESKAQTVFNKQNEVIGRR